MSLCILSFFSNLFWQTKISQFNIISIIPENISWFQISMQNFPLLMIMAFIQSQHNLSKNFPNRIFLYMFPLFLIFLNHLTNIATFTIFHYYVNFLINFIYYPIIISHNIRVFQLSYYTHLLNQLLLFFIWHFSKINPIL